MRLGPTAWLLSELTLLLHSSLTYVRSLIALSESAAHEFLPNSTPPPPRNFESSQGPPRNFLGVFQTFLGRDFQTFSTSAKHFRRTFKHFSTSSKHLGWTFKHFRPLQNIFGGLSNIFDLCKTFWADFKTF